MTSDAVDGFEQLLQGARRAQRASDHAAAAKGFRTALERRPQNVAARVALGKALLAAGDPAAARRELFTALQYDPDQMVARRLLVDANLELGDDLEAHRWLVEYLRVVADDREAEALLDDIELRLPSASPRRTRTLGELYLEQGHAEEAARVFASLADAGHDDEELHALMERAEGVAGERRAGAERLLARLHGWRRWLDMIGAQAKG